MRTIIYDSILKRISNKSVKVVKVRFLYSTVRSASLKDVLVKGAGIGAVIGFDTF